ncbi:hypothetical protein [Sutcliffiella deserti]|uniref:hypothetical protein n=1 Tax=Sutcliffiella deserti TaxID=2875501 RepID=UPI001CC0AE7B|nr:hypothetical protein [Sutcliffiella deserti]
MPTIHKNVLIIIFCLLFLATPKTYSALYEPLTFEEMVERADLIIIGKNNGAVQERIEKVVDTDIGDYDLGFTEWEIEVTSYLKGEHQGEFILISTPGPGTKADDDNTTFKMRSNEYRLDEWIEGIEKELLTKVEDILFFLEKRDGYYHPINPSAIVPLNVIDWEENIDPEVVHLNDVDPEFLEEINYLRSYLKDTPHYSPEGQLQDSDQVKWYFLIVGVVPFGFLIWYLKRNSKKDK